VDQRPALREFKFCTVFRAADRVSQYWATVHDILGRDPTLDDLSDGSFANALDTARQRNGSPVIARRLANCCAAQSPPNRHLTRPSYARHTWPFRSGKGDEDRVRDHWMGGLQA
jgi:hypothetical protein